MSTRSTVLAMGAAIAAPDTPVIFGTGLVDDNDDSSGVWYNDNDAGQPGFFQHRYKWLPSEVDAPPLADIMALGFGPPDVKIRMRVSGESVGGSSGASVLTESGGNIGIGSAAFIPAGVYADPTWFQSTTYTVSITSHWDAWRTGDVRVSPISASGATLQIAEVEVTATWPVRVAPPPLRRYPRSDGYGIGPTRHYPPPPSRRAVGGYR